MSKKTRRRQARRLPMANYLKKSLPVLSGLTPGTSTITHVYHDNWCDFNRGGECNCDPALVVVPVPDERA